MRLLSLPWFPIPLHQPTLGGGNLLALIRSDRITDHRRILAKVTQIEQAQMSYDETAIGRPKLGRVRWWARWPDVPRRVIQDADGPRRLYPLTITIPAQIRNDFRQALCWQSLSGKERPGQRR